MSTPDNKDFKSTNDRLIEHSYDGIQEYDNPMPRWWLLNFFCFHSLSV